jgi:hypothetical protein
MRTLHSLIFFTILFCPVKAFASDTLKSIKCSMNPAKFEVEHPSVIELNRMEDGRFQLYDYGMFFQAIEHKNSTILTSIIPTTETVDAHVMLTVYIIDNFDLSLKMYTYYTHSERVDVEFSGVCLSKE